MTRHRADRSGGFIRQPPDFLELPRHSDHFAVLWASQQARPRRRLHGQKQTSSSVLLISVHLWWSQPVDATLYLKGEMECALMGQRFHRGFTAAEKTELWDRWKRGESLKAIGRAFGKPSSSIYFLVAPHGGIRPAERRRSRLALTLAE